MVEIELLKITFEKTYFQDKTSTYVDQILIKTLIFCVFNTIFLMVNVFELVTALFCTTSDAGYKGRNHLHNILPIACVEAVSKQ